MSTKEIDRTDSVWMEPRYKLIATAEKLALYDLLLDPSESQNLVESQPQVTQRMQEQLLEWKREVMSELAQIP